MTTPHSHAAANSPAPPMAHPGVELISQFQATTRSLLEFQQSQQRLVERFLDFQERMLYTCIQGARRGWSWRAADGGPGCRGRRAGGSSTSRCAGPNCRSASHSGDGHDARPARVVAATSVVKAPLAIPNNGSSGSIPRLTPQPAAVPRAATVPVATAPAAAAPATNGHVPITRQWPCQCQLRHPPRRSMAPPRSIRSAANCWKSSASEPAIRSTCWTKSYRWKLA